MAPVSQARVALITNLTRILQDVLPDEVCNHAVIDSGWTLTVNAAVVAGSPLVDRVESPDPDRFMETAGGEHIVQLVGRGCRGLAGGAKGGGIAGGGGQPVRHRHGRPWGACGPRNANPRASSRAKTDRSRAGKASELWSAAPWIRLKSPAIRMRWCCGSRVPIRPLTFERARWAMASA